MCRPHINFSKPPRKQAEAATARATSASPRQSRMKLACPACPSRAGVPLCWMQDAVGARSVTTGWDLCIRSCQSWGYYRSHTTLGRHRPVSRLGCKPLQSSRRGQIGFGSCAGLAGWLGQAGSAHQIRRSHAWRLPPSLTWSDLQMIRTLHLARQAGSAAAAREASPQYK